MLLLPVSFSFCSLTMKVKIQYTLLRCGLRITTVSHLPFLLSVFLINIYRETNTMRIWSLGCGDMFGLLATRGIGWRWRVCCVGFTWCYCVGMAVEWTTSESFGIRPSGRRVLVLRSENISHYFLFKVLRVLISVLQTKFVGCNIEASSGVLILLLKFLFRRQSLAASNTHWPWTAFGLPGCQRVPWTCGQRLPRYVWITGVTRR